MSVGLRNVRFGLVGVPFGLIYGLLIALYAFVPMVPVPAGLDDYAALPRRLLRLAHIAAVMLPTLNLVLGPWIDRVALGQPARLWTSRLLIFGAVGLPLALTLQALSPLAARLHVTGVPAVAFTAGTALLAIGALRMPR